MISNLQTIRIQTLGHYCHEIESYLLSSGLLKSRVVELLTNYRRKWRNPSTHDHRLFFSAQEAFLAIVSVSAFASILIDQVVERLAFTRKREELEQLLRPAKDVIPGFMDLSFIDKVVAVLGSYAKYYMKRLPEMTSKSRTIRDGELAAFLQRTLPDFHVENGPELRGCDESVNVDIAVTHQSERLAIDTQEGGRYTEMPSEGGDSSIEHLVEQLGELGWREGIVFYYPEDQGHSVITVTANSSWPRGFTLREVFADDPNRYSNSDLQPSDLER